MRKLDSLPSPLADAAVESVETERAATEFSVEALTHVLDGGAAATAERRAAWRAFAADPVLNDGLERFTMPLKEERALSTAKLFRLADMLSAARAEAGEGEAGEAELVRLRRNLMRALEVFDPSVAIRAFVQHGLWIGTLKNQGTPEQQAKWLPGAEDYRIIGCFAMTELAHSSFLRGAETRAELDVDTDEFVISSPSLTATKWWIGQAGQIATHAIVFANTFLPNSAAGIQLFVVPLRDAATGKPLPGITIGDIGPKFGRHGNDNGFISFDAVRVPRFNMLARWASVESDGSFIPPPNPALAYGSTILERVSSVGSAADYASQALTIAIRFGVARRQGSGHVGSSPSAPEPQIMDYQSHICGLIPHLATCYAVFCTTARVEAGYNAMVADLQAGNTLGFLAPLADMHATSCGLKTVCTWWASDALEACRRSMGGTDITRTRQTARYLVKIYSQVHGIGHSGSRRVPPGDSVAYLLDASLPRFDSLGALVAEAHSLDALLVGIQQVAVAKIGAAATRLHSAMIVDGMSKGEAWNACLMDLVDAVTAHCTAYMMESFTAFVAAREAEGVDDALIQVLTTLARLFALRYASEHTTWFIEANMPAKSSDAISSLRRAVESVASSLRPSVIGLTDAFDYPDELLRAPLGVKSGDVYREYYRAASTNALNEPSGVAPYWRTLVSPRLLQSKL
ncbi:palmitoyl acyl-CoA oxidase 1 [Thecamonas trahens ATCC 50062]|uniref:Acyl-coenzyme A oxidase n=1 Tax=Thecamonas trahens ATCC 50062 TaxID=461836 RepID=A0A0L0DVR7_THETB|nr:palmitoyl acyl-CoA oxidase 1 [Thecamonas trahens ATCC 50062]KNC55608.1 palmitoyl acyl-CoA oxidase 1 [Thecamonas trahens ATCC 50062]|eukprot:XP_013761381.1 palmitoyl acyl-CoA oxidase 1 [Thecamonas trahens ATCC 50062]